MHVCGIQKIVRDISKRASSYTAKHVTPHVLRHTMASVAIENNADIISVQKILGHTNINTTMTYIHKNLDSAKNDHLRSVI